MSKRRELRNHKFAPNSGVLKRQEWEFAKIGKLQWMIWQMTVCRSPVRLGHNCNMEWLEQKGGGWVAEVNDVGLGGENTRLSNFARSQYPIKGRKTTRETGEDGKRGYRRRRLYLDLKRDVEREWRCNGFQSTYLASLLQIWQIIVRSGNKIWDVRGVRAYNKYTTKSGRVRFDSRSH